MLQPGWQAGAVWLRAVSTSFGTLPQSSNASGQRISWNFAPSVPPQWDPISSQVTLR